MIARSMILAALAVCISGSALANDGSAEMTAGGLVLRNNNIVDMVEEDLFISTDQVRVRYLFRNPTRRGTTVTVAFPIPDRDLRYVYESDVSAMGDFRTRVDGRPVRMSMEQRAFVNGMDRTAALMEAGVPIVPTQVTMDGGGDTQGALRRLGPVQRRRLAALGLIALDDPTTPLWRARQTYYWTQTFPAGRNVVIEHSYRPGPGGSATMALASDEFRNGEEGRRQIAEYCVDRDFLAGLDRLRRTRINVSETTLGYILRTGGTWRSPIRRFRLVVDKGAGDNLVSFCGEGVRRIGPTRFEMVRQNWRPTQDLRILVAVPAPADAR